MPHRILVVDDEPDLEPLILQRFRKRIRSEELHFSFAAHGEQALEKVRDQPVDIVLTDINMPVMDGLTLLGRLRSDHPMLRSVVVSAYGDMANIRTALNRGAFDFVTKPIDFQDLEITLDKAIEDAVLRKQAARDRENLMGLGRELNLARSIQESLVPSTFPTDGRFEIFGSMVPAAEVGGDLFDFFPLDERRLAFAIGDISGKGIGAALFMAVSRTVLRVAGGKGLSTPECLNEVNRYLCADNTNGLFLTCFYGILDLVTGELQYSRAAHNHPYVVRADAGGTGANAVQILADAGGLPLAMFDTTEYGAARARLTRGDYLVLYTDGVTESMSPEQEPYDDARLVELLRTQTLDVPPGDVVRRVIGAAQEFAAGSPPSDDMTVMVIRYLG